MHEDSTRQAEDVPYGYCRCGCGQKTNIARQAVKKYGVAKGEPQRYVKGHCNGVPAGPVAPRFWSKVDRSGGPFACWNWTAALYPNGYGAFGLAGKAIGAHRIAWQLERGPIPDGLDLDHLCRNRACVNPDHLEPVTRSVNLRRGIGVAGMHARKTHCVNGHEFTPENTYIPPKGGRHCRACRKAANDASYLKHRARPA